MERQKLTQDLTLTLVLGVFFAVGITGHLFSSTRGIMLLLTPYTLFFAAFLLLTVLYRKADKTLFWWIGLSYFSTFLIEVIGVKTGFIFGDYSYGKTLGIKIFETPLIIGLNWVFVILGASLSAKRIFSNRFAAAFFTAFLAVIFDFLLEPVAVNLDYWSWSGGIIPLQNYAAWFIISFIYSYMFFSLKLTVTTTLPENYFYIQIIFFLVLNSAL